VDGFSVKQLTLQDAFKEEAELLMKGIILALSV
jgi:hypothetical protein